MIILGINLTTHDSSVALIKDGVILADIAEERLSRIKMDGNPPTLSINKVLEITGIKESDIDILAFSDMQPGIKRLFYFFWQQAQRVFYTKGAYLRSFLIPNKFSIQRLKNQTGILGIKKAIETRKATAAIIQNFKDKGFLGKIEFVDHDLAHASGAYYTSGFTNGLVSVIEGSSFTNACSFWIGNNNSLKKVFETPLPHSPGRYYEIVTLILGFHPKKHGGKITGLAALGNPKKCYDRVKRLFYFTNGEIKVSPELYSLHDEYFANGNRLPKIFQGESREDIAAAFQKRLEDVICEQIKYLQETYREANLLLSGGVCANVKMNYELSKIDGVKNLFVHPGMGDMGQALGSALWVQAKYHKDFLPKKFTNAYLGPEFNSSEIESALKESGLKYSKSDNISKETAFLLSQNKVIGFFQGRMEYGPRALGNRTILYPATDPEVNKWLNNRLKRTEFMPFAPVTLYERAEDCYLDLGKNKFAAEFMTVTLPVTEYMKKNMPAAVHVDGTARPQLIKEETNYTYYNVLKEYEKLTGLPSLINTSFNMHEEPIVCTPKEAISAFLQSKLDALVIGDYLVLSQ